jgi:hypothetical protein
MMIATAAVAALLAIPSELRGILAFLAIPLLTPFAAWWLVRQGDRRVAGFCFWVPAAIANIAVACCMIAPDGWFAIWVFLVAFFVLIPTLGALGLAWASLAVGGTRPRVWMRLLIALTVDAVALAPSATAWSKWPLEAAFVVARPGLDRLAARVAAGQPVTYPQWVGPLRVRGSRINPATGIVTLLTETDPGHPAGFVRGRGSSPAQYDCSGTILGDALHVGLWEGWCYHSED